MKALVLSGGGARGAFEAGAIESLRAFGSYDVVCGTSAGAINAAFVAQDAYDDLREVWHNIGSRSVIQYISIVRHVQALISRVKAIFNGPFLGRVGALIQVPYEFLCVVSRVIFGIPSLLRLLGVVNPNPITQMLAKYLRYQALTRPLIVTATNLSMPSADTFYFPADDSMSAFAAKRKAGTARYPITETNYVNTIQASTSIPGAFPPVEVATKNAKFKYVDGGVANNTPIGMAVDAGATEITIVFVEPADPTPQEQVVTNIAQIGMTCLGVMQQKILDDDLKLALAYNAAVAAGAGASTPRVAGKRLVDIYVVRPAATLALSVLDFDNQALLDEAYEAGRIAGRNRLRL